MLKFITPMILVLLFAEALIQAKPYGEENWYDRMQVDPGYISDSPQKPGKGCGGKPADVYFLIDTSDVVGKKDFDRALEYVSDIIPTFDQDKTRIGVITYSDAVYSMIGFGEYLETSKLQAAVRRIRYDGGEPNTGRALRYLREKGFSRRIARRGVGHIAIVITNGKSRNTKEVILEAQLAHNAGVYLYAVYPNDRADGRELSTIASKPEDNFLFSMDSYNIVTYLEDVLGSAPCDIQVHPWAPEDNTICDTKRPADILFGLDTLSLGVKNSKRILEFVSLAIDVLNIGSDRIHAGVVTSNCPSDLDIGLGDHYTKYALLRNVESLTFPGQAELLKKMRRRSFSRFYGARWDVQHTAVLFVDDELENPNQVVQEAMRTRSRKVHIIVVAIGPTINARHLSKIATSEDFVFRVNSYGDLLNSQDDLMKLICKGL